MGLWYPNWDPKNSGCLAGTQRMGGGLRVSGGGKTRACGRRIYEPRPVGVGATGPHGNGYSARIAITGSTRVARHAGTKLARSPTTKRVVVTSA